MDFFLEQFLWKVDFFQGCPILPLSFLCAIEVLAIYIRNNENICGIKIGGVEKKVFWQITQLVFYKVI